MYITVHIKECTYILTRNAIEGDNQVGLVWFGGIGQLGEARYARVGVCAGTKLKGQFLNKCCVNAKFKGTYNVLTCSLRTLTPVLLAV